MPSRSFGSKRPLKVHLLRGKSGLGAEIADLRSDTDSGFSSLEDEVDVLSAEVAGLISAPGGVQTLSVTAPITKTGTASNPTVGISAASAIAAGSMSAAHYSLCQGATDTNTGNTLVKRDSGGKSVFSKLVAAELNAPGALALGNDPITLSVAIGSVGITTTINGPVVFAGPTFRMDSVETLDVVDRVPHFGHMPGVAPVPTQIVGFAVERGSVDGTTKRDMPFFGWSETVSSLIAAYNTAGDDSTIGADIPIRAAGLDRVSGGILYIGAAVQTGLYLGRTGQSIRLVSLAGNGNGLVAVDNLGNLSWAASISSDFGAQNITTTGSITAGADGLIAPKLDRASGGVFTLGSNITTLAANAMALTGIASVDNSGATLNLGANATAQTIGKTATVATFAGGVTINGSNAADVLRTQKNGIGTTKTAALWIENTTNSGTQVSPMEVWSAFNSSTQVNLGFQWEPQSSSRGKLVLYTGTGSTAPSGSGNTYWDSQDAALGEGWVSPGFYVSAVGSTVGFRFMSSSNRGGFKYRWADDSLYISSYNNKAFGIDTGADSNGTGGSTRINVEGTGNIALFGTGSYGGGTLVLFVANATTVPTTNPTGGGILYVEGGALKYRGSSGTVTTVAPA